MCTLFLTASRIHRTNIKHNQISLFVPRWTGEIQRLVKLVKVHEYRNGHVTELTSFKSILENFPPQNNDNTQTASYWMLLVCRHCSMFNCWNLTFVKTFTGIRNKSFTCTIEWKLLYYYYYLLLLLRKICIHTISPLQSI